MKSNTESFPFKAYIDICSQCNHQCSFCSNSDPRTVKNIMSFKDYKVILDNLLRDTQLKSLGLYSKGEPFLNKDIFEMIEYAKSKNIAYVFITTNGSLLNPVNIQKIFESGLDSIKFSINATDARSYKSVHQKDCFDDVIKSLEDVLKLKKEQASKMKVLVSVVSNSLQKEDVVGFYQRQLGECYHYLDLIIVNSIGYTPKEDEAVQTCDLDLQQRCPRPFEEINVTASGELNLCCMDFFEEYNFGSLKSMALHELWNNQEFSAIRQMHQSGKFPQEHLCYKCLLTRNLTKSLDAIEKSIG